MNYRKHLTEDVLPFWLEHAIDEECGGIFTHLDRFGNVYCKEEKSGWFQGRALYIFSLAYNRGIRDPRLLAAAKNIFDFLPRCGDQNLRMGYILARDGTPTQKRKYFFSETFAAIGCCEYRLATGDESAKTLAEAYFDLAYSLYETPESLGSNELHELSPCMILLTTAHVLRKINPVKYDGVAAEMTKDVLLHFTDKGMLENVFPNGQIADTPTGRIVNPGHSLEAAWFLMTQGELTDDPALLDIAVKIIDKAIEYGLTEDGGILNFRDADDKPTPYLDWDMKKWWPQCEAMLATKMCYYKTGNPKYLSLYNRTREFVETHFIDTEFGEWYGYLHYDGTVSNPVKGNIGKGPFHIPRMFMLLEKMDELAEKGEKLLIL